MLQEVRKRELAAIPETAQPQAKRRQFSPHEGHKADSDVITIKDDRGMNIYSNNYNSNKNINIGDVMRCHICLCYNP